jgi:hypothetical protein
MTTPVSVTVLLEPETEDEILATTLEVAEVVGLPVTTWRVGDPTRTQFRAQARKLAAADVIQTELAKAAFITGPEGQRAEGEWLTLRVSDVYGVDRDEEEFATPTVTLDNAGGGVFEVDALGATFSNSATGATYKNQLPFTIDALETGVEVLLIADDGGSAGTVGVDEIDTIVSPPLLGISITGNTAGTGVDEQSDTGLIEQALATLGALSPNGPADAYEFVARSEALTTVAGVTRALADGDSTDGTVTVYVATTTAAISAPNVVLIQAAVDTWAQPICTDATVVSGTAQTVAVTLSGLDSDAQDVVEAALDTLFASIEFAGLIALDAITSAARVAAVAGGYPPTGAVACTLPVADQTLATGVFPVRGTVTLL